MQDKAQLIIEPIPKLHRNVEEFLEEHKGAAKAIRRAYAAQNTVFHDLFNAMLDQPIPLGMERYR